MVALFYMVIHTTKKPDAVTNIAIEVPEYGPSSNHPGPKKNYTLQTLNPKPLTRSMDPLPIVQDPKRITLFRIFRGRDRSRLWDCPVEVKFNKIQSSQGLGFRV